MVDVVAEDFEVGSLERPAGIVGRSDCGAENVAEVGAVFDLLGNEVNRRAARLGLVKRIFGHPLDLNSAVSGGPLAVLGNVHKLWLDGPEADKAGIVTLSHNADWERRGVELAFVSVWEFSGVQLVGDCDCGGGDVWAADAWCGDKYFAHCFFLPWGPAARHIPIMARNL